MPLEGDERAVTVVIGAVLMFGILVTSLAMYQVNVVPDQNQQVEWDHHQEVTADLLDLRNAVVNAGYENSTRETSVSLGTQYESRTFSINPPDPRGTIRTNSTGNPQVQINTSDDEYSFNTSYIEYEPGYHEYDAPTTVIEHGLIYDEHGHVNVTRDAGSVISDERIIIPLIEGDLSESSRSKASITVETIDVYHVSADVTEIQLSTDAFEAWNESYDEVDPKDGDVSLTGVEQEVYVARIAVGDDRSGNGNTSSKLESFGDPVTNLGGSGESNEFGLEWAEDSKTASPGETVALTAEINPSVENARADFSYRDSPGIVDSFDPTAPVQFQNGEATAEVDISGGADDDEMVQVYVSSGGSTRKATVTVEAGSAGGATVAVDSFDAPASGTEGEEIQPTATVTNVGNESGTATVEYVFDGTVVDNATVSLDPGQSETVAFAYTLPGDGTYDHYAQTDADATTPAQIEVEPAQSDVEFTASDVATDDTVQRFTYSLDSIGNKQEMTIDLSDAQGNVIDYSDGTVAVTSGQDMESVTYDSGSDEIRLSLQGNSHGMITVEISDIDVIGESGGTATIGYSDATGNADSDSFAIGQGVPAFESLEATANIDGYAWIIPYSESVSLEYALDAPSAVTSIEFTAYDGTGAEIGTETLSEPASPTMIGLAETQFQEMDVEIVVHSSAGQRCLTGSVSVGETIDRAAFSPCS